MSDEFKPVDQKKLFELLRYRAPVVIDFKGRCAWKGVYTTSVTSKNYPASVYDTQGNYVGRPCSFHSLDDIMSVLEDRRLLGEVPPDPFAEVKRLNQAGQHTAAIAVGHEIIEKNCFLEDKLLPGHRVIHRKGGAVHTLTSLNETANEATVATNSGAVLVENLSDIVRVRFEIDDAHDPTPVTQTTWEEHKRCRSLYADVDHPLDTLMDMVTVLVDLDVDCVFRRYNLSRLDNAPLDVAYYEWVDAGKPT